MFIETSWPAANIAVLTINRDEKRNALSAEVCDELTDAIEAASETARAIVITGAGSAFSAGADLSTGDPEAIYPALSRLVAYIRTVPIAVIGHINGPAIGAGALLASACDIRVVDPSAHFAIPVAKMGVEVTPGIADAFAGLVGGARARAMLMTGASMDSDESVASGFAMRQGSADDAIEAARVCVEGSAKTIASIKKAFA